MEESLTGFGGGVFWAFLRSGDSGFCNGGSGGVKVGHSGMSWAEFKGLEIGREDLRLVVSLGGFGGAIGGGLTKTGSSSSDVVEPVSDGGLGGGMEGGCSAARSIGGSMFPKNSCGGGIYWGDGGMNCGGGGGGAIEGGAGIRICPSSGSATLIMPPFGSLSWLPVFPLCGPFRGGRTGTVGVGTANPRAPSPDVLKCLTVGLDRTLAVPDSGMAAESSTNSRFSKCLIWTPVSKRF